MAESTVAMPETEQTQAVTQPETHAVEATRPREQYMTPPVDIYETPESLVVIADVPGIDPAHLEVRVDKNILTLRGQTQHQMPGDLRSREYTLVSFFRQFELGERIDQDGIRADLKQGVLTLTLAKAAKAQPRAITVNAAYAPGWGGAPSWRWWRPSHRGPQGRREPW